MTPLMIAALGLLMVATAFLSGLFGMAGGLILIGVLLTMPLPWRWCCTRSRRWPRTAGAPAVAQPHQVAAGFDLHDRMRAGAWRVVDHPLCARQAGRAAFAGGDAVHGAADAR
jgi:hypothetical protein